MDSWPRRQGSGNQDEAPGWRLGKPAAVLLLTLVVGTIGYKAIEGWSTFDAFYMVVTTVMTVGFGELHPLSTAGRVFTMGLILTGVATISYALSVMVGIVFEGQLTRRWEQRRLDRRLHHLTDHYIICGFGRVGRQTARELRREGRAIVVLDIKHAALAEAASEGMSTVFGNATEDDALRAAGIERAHGLITAVASDADNVFVALSARALRPDLLIVARANYDDAVPKLRRAGASQVVSPYTMAGQQMARLAVRPSTVDFVETLFRGGEGGLLFEDVRVAANAPIAGTPLAEARDRFAEGAILVAVQRAGKMLAPPPTGLVLQADDVIAVVGTSGQLRALERASESAVG